MDSPVTIAMEADADDSVVCLHGIAGDNVIVITLDPSLIVGVAEAFERIGDATRDIVQQIHRLSDSFAEMCVRALRKEEVCYESRPVESERRHHTNSEMGCNAGLALPALNRRDIMHSERW